MNLPLKLSPSPACPTYAMSSASIVQSERLRELSPGLRLSLVLLVLMVTLPSLQPIHHAPITSFYEEWWAIFLGTLAIVAALTANLPRIALPSVALIPVVLCFATILQFMSGQITVRLLGGFYCGYLTWAMAMACLGATLAEHLGRARLFRVLAMALLTSALASALLAFAQRLEIHLPSQFALPSFGSINANVGQTNLLNTYLWIGIVSLIYLRERSTATPVLTFAGILLLGAAAGLTGSRTAYLNGCGMILLSLLLKRNRHKSDSLAAPTWPYFLAAIAAVFVAGEISRILPWKFLTDTNTFSRFRSGLVSGDARLDIWRDALSMIMDHPWIGNGVGNFPWRLVEVASTAPSGASTYPGFEHAHNFFLQIGADFGIPLLILIVFLSGRWLVQLLTQEQESELAGKWAISVIALVAIHSQLEYPLWYADYLGLCALILGAIDPRLRLLTALHQRVLKIAFAATAVALIPLRLDYGTLDEALNIRRNSKEDWQKRVGILATLGTQSMLAPYANWTLASLMTPERKLASEQSYLCERAMHLDPDLYLITNCAVLRQLAGHESEGRELYSLVQHAWRLPADQVAIRKVIALAAKNNPEINRLGIPAGQ